MATFKGYPRIDGSVGIRNHVIITSTVACSNGAVLRVAEENPGLISMCTVGGCGNSHGSPDFNNAVQAICMHPNVYAAIIIGLGCEDTDAQVLADKLTAAGYKVFARRIQHDGGSDVVCQEASAAAKRFLAEAAQMQPTDCPIEKLAVGFRFGAEDAYTSLYTNPAFGYASDWLVSQGAAAVISQTASFLGGERQIIGRAANRRVSEKLTEVYANTRYQMSEYYKTDVSAVTEKDKCLGFSTPAERAAAHFSLAGHTPIEHVIDAAGRLNNYRGLIFQDGTALDTAGITDLLVSGAQMAFISSSELSVLGWPAAPVIKVATNSEAFTCSPGDMDMNAGLTMERGLGAEALGQEIVQKILSVANGEKSAAEVHEHDGGVFETHFRIMESKRPIITPAVSFC